MSKFLDRKIKWDNKMYKAVPWIPDEDEHCIGCAFNADKMSSACNSHKLRTENRGDCPDDIIFIPATKQGTADYIAKRLAQEEIDALRKAEAVAMRLEGKKLFELQSRETVYYSRIIWAKDAEEAENIAHDECEYGEAVDYDNWQFDGCEEITE